MRVKIPGVYMRGGTSKAVFFHEGDLPQDPSTRDRFILAAYGSPDPDGLQADGMGGSLSTTSKVAIIGPSQNPDFDVRYTFGQVSIDKRLISYRGNCGNICAAVGPFAIEEGLVGAEEPITTVRIHQVNTDKLILAEIPVRDGLYEEAGSYAIDGVPGTGGKISLRFVDPGASVADRLLPTGNVEDILDTPGLGEVTVSIVDAGNPVVFVRAGDLGLRGTEIDAIEDNLEIKQTLETIRGQGAVLMGLVSCPEEASAGSQSVPKIAVVSPGQDFKVASGRTVREEDMDVVVRMMSMGTLHRTCAITGAVCAAGAAKIPGTIVNELVGGSALEQGEIRLGHPGGVMPVTARVVRGDAGHEYREAIVNRTARRLMDGHVYVRRTDLDHSFSRHLGSD